MRVSTRGGVLSSGALGELDSLCIFGYRIGNSRPQAHPNNHTNQEYFEDFTSSGCMRLTVMCGTVTLTLSRPGRSTAKRNAGFVP